MNRYPTFIDPTCSTFGEEPERLPLYLTLLAVLVCVLFDGELE